MKSNPSDPKRPGKKLHTALLIGGSNIGDRIAYLDKAREELESTDCSVTDASTPYLTAPWGNSHQEDFLNIAWKIQTVLSPSALLQRVLDIEKKNGTEPHSKMGATQH